MKRKAYAKLLEWKNSDCGRTALMLDGARRVGKSYLAEEFARNEYESYILIDFSKAGTKVKELFDLYLDDLDTFFMYLQSAFHVTLKRRKSLIVFDEVQRFPKAREAIKHLVKDGRHDYLETGSLISLYRNVKDIVIPSEEEHVEIFPMDFEEFLWALGDETTMPLIRKRFEECAALGNSSHRQITALFRQYMIVGGMPQAVERYAATHDLKAVDRIKRGILRIYREDIHKFAGGDRLKVAAIFDDIPSQLSRHEKRFVLANVRANAKSRDFVGAFEWLSESMIVNMAYRATEPNIGLRLNRDSSALKCYLGDTGLLLSLAFDERELSAEDIHQRILFDKIEFNAGMIVENIVAQMLRTAGKKLYYYSNSSREAAEDRMEIDFLISKSKVNRRKNVSPIEVKSGTRFSTVSLDKFRRKYAAFVGNPIVLYPGDVKSIDGVAYYPHYMASLL